MARPYSMASMAHSPLELQAPSLPGHRASISDIPPGSHGSGVSPQPGTKQAATPPEDMAAPPDILGELSEQLQRQYLVGCLLARR